MGALLGADPRGAKEGGGVVLPGGWDGSEAAWLCGERNEVEARERAFCRGSSAPTEPEHLTLWGCGVAGGTHVSRGGSAAWKDRPEACRGVSRWYCHQMTGTRMCHALSLHCEKTWTRVCRSYLSGGD